MTDEWYCSIYVFVSCCLTPLPEYISPLLHAEELPTDTWCFSFAYCQFNDMINVVFSSKAFVGGATALLLDSTLHRHDSTARKDRGHHFWDRFRSFKTDPRSEEFYSLPFNLNKFFPSVWAKLWLMQQDTKVTCTNLPLPQVLWNGKLLGWTVLVQGNPMPLIRVQTLWYNRHFGVLLELCSVC